MKGLGFSGYAVLFAAGVTLGGCLDLEVQSGPPPPMHLTTDEPDPSTLPDVEVVPVVGDLTVAETVEGTLNVSSANGGSAAPVPVPVESVDPNAVMSAGGKKLVDGMTWDMNTPLDRGRWLEEAWAKLPQDQILVRDARTGDVWNLGTGTDTLISSGKVKAFDFGNARENYGLGPNTTPLTEQEYKSRTSVSLPQWPSSGTQTLTPRIGYVHDLGRMGTSGMAAQHGVEILPPGIWSGLTPGQRGAFVMSEGRFFEHLAAFQRAANEPMFGVTVPWGAVYAIPQQGYEGLLRGRDISVWQPWETQSLPFVPPYIDRSIRQHSYSMPMPRIDERP